MACETSNLTSWHVWKPECLPNWVVLYVLFPVQLEVLSADMPRADGLKWSDWLMWLIHLNCLIPDTPDAVSQFRQIVMLMMWCFASATRLWGLKGDWSSIMKVTQLSIQWGQLARSADLRRSGLNHSNAIPFKYDWMKVILAWSRQNTFTQSWKQSSHWIKKVWSYRIEYRTLYMMMEVT